MPGFATGKPLALLPFWGNWCLADFAVASVWAAARVKVVLEEEVRSFAPLLASRWKGRKVETAVTDGSPAGLQRLLEAEDADVVALAAFSAVWLTEPSALERLAASAAGLVKASVQRTPIELYVGRRDPLLAALAGAAQRSARARGVRQVLFDGILAGGLDAIEEVPGELYFLNDLTDLHRRTLALAHHGSEVLATAARLPEVAEPAREARIAERARVSSSWISPGAEVEGSVEQSVLFPGAVVRRGAQVERSVVMNGVTIGSGAVVQNALLLPGSGDAGNGGSTPTIGERCIVGSRSSVASNAAWPESIREGLAVVGMDVALPPGFRMEGGSLVSPGATVADLRRLKVLRRGQSLPGRAA